MSSLRVRCVVAVVLCLAAGKSTSANSVAPRVQPVNYAVSNPNYRWHNGRWWYWMPNNTWSYWNGAAWSPYTPAGYGAFYNSYYGVPQYRTNYYYPGRYSYGPGYYRGYYRGYPYRRRWYGYRVAPRRYYRGWYW